ncbi:MAG TPA: hypothetical protein PLH19_06870 [Anaerolineae bacterium]|nr:hypothetical protein [Anaerolineae bacterium]HQH38244.1 hypothetical protein [Anaerolineae bacterium]
MTGASKKKPLPEQPPLRVTQGWGQQMLGALIGALVMGMVMRIGPAWGWTPTDRTRLLLIGGMVGAMIFSLDRFAQAGSRLTRRTEGRGARWLNILVALLGLALVAGAFIGLTYLVGRLINSRG